MSLLGIEVPTDTDETEYSNRLEVHGMESIDSLGQVICQSSLQVKVKDEKGALQKSLDLSLRMTPDAIEPIFSGGAWAGTVLWRAAIRLVDLALLSGKISLHGKSCVELGCGLGVPGMIAAALGAQVVALTEQENLVSLIDRNIAANFSSSNDTSIIVARELDWCSHQAIALRNELLQGHPFDIVLCCDCVYIPLYGDSWRALVEAIIAVSGPKTQILVAVERRFVKDGTDGVDLFLEAMHKANFISSLIAEPPMELYSFTTLHQ